MIFDKNYSKIDEKDIVVYENETYVVSFIESTWLLLDGLKFNGSIRIPISGDACVIECIELKSNNSCDDWNLFSGLDY